MKKFHLFIAFIFLVFKGCDLNNKDRVTVDLKPKWDSVTALENPHKGWYHHLLDNGIGKYEIRNEELVDRFPGLDHFYLRLAWAYLEPEEGKFDWSYIDEVVEKYVSEGYGISFRITSKETGPAPTSVPEVINGVHYATPYWVRQAGAEGTVVENGGRTYWSPDWVDPVYLEKLGNFHRAFAEKYDGQSWVRYVDVGSIGEWGEGHTHRSTKIPPTVEEVKANIDIYLDHYKNSQIVVTDDLLYWNKDESDVAELYDYAMENGISLRDDSPLVGWYVENDPETYSVSHPHFYEPLYLDKPIVFELQHYQSVIDDGNWIGKNGEGVIEGKGISGADLFKNAMKLEHSTYIGYHGYLGQWLKDNPDLTRELANKCGYWYFPVSAVLPSGLKAGEDSEISITWINKGVAPAYNEYELMILLEPGNTSHDDVILTQASGNLEWLPDSVVTKKYKVSLPEDMQSGEYRVKFKLRDPSTERDVLVGLTSDLNDEENFYEIGTVTVH